MTDFKVAKVVASVPSPPEPDTLYFVRTGEGFDIYLTNGVGEVSAYKLNTPSASPAGGFLMPGKTYWSRGRTSILGTGQMSLPVGVMCIGAFQIEAPVTLVSVGVVLTTATAGAQGALALYKPGNGRWLDSKVWTGNPKAVAAGDNVWTSSQQLTPGLYIPVFVADKDCQVRTSDSVDALAVFGMNGTNDNNVIPYFTAPGSIGSLPETITAGPAGYHRAGIADFHFAVTG